MSQHQVFDILTSRDTVLAIAVASATLVLIRVLRPGSRTTPLRGPPRESLLFGQSEVLRKADRECAAPAIQEGWVNEYGSVFKRPMALGSDAVVLTDPKAVAHFYGGGETIYGASTFAKRALVELLGRGILLAEGDDHKRQRRALSAGFSNAKLREYTTVFFESAYKVKAAWDQKLESSDAFQVDVASWMNAISLDSMGLAGFAHDFGALHGKQSAVGESFAGLAKIPMNFLNILVFLLQPVLPILVKLPSERTRMRDQMSQACGKLARQLLANVAGVEETVDSKSVLGLLIKSQTASTGFPMTEEEVNSQMRTLMVAGYETTSVSMTWGLIELARNPDIQTALRKELREKFSTSDPTWDELMTDLPMLDAVVHETLRLHPSVPETLRQPIKDDIIPLSSPVRLPNGQMTDHIFVEAGQKVAVPIAVVNRLRSLWGEDAWEFKPERWLDNGEGIPAAAKDIQGHRHLITFINGPRTCLGKNFAVAECKAALSVLIRNYVFELPNGPQTVIHKHLALAARPTVEGQPRCHVPIRITRVD